MLPLLAVDRYSRILFVGDASAWLGRLCAWPAVPRQNGGHSFTGMKTLKVYSPLGMCLNSRAVPLQPGTDLRLGFAEVSIATSSSMGLASGWAGKTVSCVLNNSPTDIKRWIPSISPLSVTRLDDFLPRVIPWDGLLVPHAVSKLVGNPT